MKPYIYVPIKLLVSTHLFLMIVNALMDILEMDLFAQVKNI